MYIHSESLFSRLHIEIKHKCLKKPSDKINVTNVQKLHFLFVREPPLITVLL